MVAWVKGSRLRPREVGRCPSQKQELCHREQPGAHSPPSLGVPPLCRRGLPAPEEPVRSRAACCANPNPLVCGLAARILVSRAHWLRRGWGAQAVLRAQPTHLRQAAQASPVWWGAQPTRPHTDTVTQFRVLGRAPSTPWFLSSSPSTRVPSFSHAACVDAAGCGQRAQGWVVAGTLILVWEVWEVPSFCTCTPVPGGGEGGVAQYKERSSHWSQ